MKKVFTLLALLTCFLGANAQGGHWERVASIDFSTFSAFPHYVMGYVPEFDNGCMTDYGANYGYKTDDEMVEFTDGTEVGTVTHSNGTVYHKVQLNSPGWHQYFVITGFDTKIDGKYKVVAKVKASEACSFNVEMRWSWSENPVGANVSIPEGSDFQEVEWEYSGIGGTRCDLIAQPGGFTGTIEWQSVTVYEWQKDNQKPKEWKGLLENGDAEKPWGDLADVRFNDMENNYKICAWGKQKGTNVNADGGSDPFPATIEEDPSDPSNHVFVVHGAKADSPKDANGNNAWEWDNQFWIEAPREIAGGEKVHVHFRYKASQNAKAGTQIHHQSPSDYLHWQCIGNVDFTTEWQEFDKDVIWDSNGDKGWSICFNLNVSVQDPMDFYFDDLQISELVLEEGYFVSGINTNTTNSYDDLDTAIQFVEGEDPAGDPCLVATVGEKGNSDTFVDQLIISTKRGDDEAYKAASLLTTSKIVLGEWIDYEASRLAKIDLPGLGAWNIYLDPEYSSLLFELVDGELYEEPDPIDIVTNASEIVVNATEREYTEAEAAEAGIDKPENPGQPWDNQLFIKANRILKTGEATVIEFDYVANMEAKTSTQCHAQPGDYRGGGVGEVNFTTELQHFKADFVVPSHEKNDIQTMVFNLAEIKDACNYTIKNVKWYLKYDEEGKTLENLINETGQENFSYKVGAGAIVPADPTGIENIVNDKKASAVTYNLAGQRVSKDYKGIVIKNGAKYIAK